MFTSLYRQTDIQLRRGHVSDRREFLRTISAASLAAGTLSWTDLMAAQQTSLRRRGKSCILLWMNGGPSQFETFSPKPGHANGGETKAIPTAVSGIEISEYLPETAKMANEMCILRSMTSKEGSHPRATFLLHTGYLPTASVRHPSLGSVASQQLGDTAADLPSYVRIGGNNRNAGGGGGLLGVQHDPLNIRNPHRAPDNSSLTVAKSRFQRRLGLLGKVDRHYAAAVGKNEVTNHEKIYEQASRMVLSPRMSVFDIDEEPVKIREAYGEGDFAAGCLMARRLVEAGVTFVEVSMNGWDTHQDNTGLSQELCGQMDRPYAQLLTDLRQRGRLDDTLVIWMGEFGRTPRINGRGGRDHYPRAFNAVVAGCGVQSGQTVGATDPGGVEVTERPVTVQDLFQTICYLLEIDSDKENLSSIGRPIRVVDGGEVVTEIVG